jgi:hypothetical protein
VSLNHGQLVLNVVHLLLRHHAYEQSYGHCSISTVMMSRLVLNLHEAAARTAHAPHAMRTVENMQTRVGEELELEVLAIDSEPVAMDSRGSGDLSRLLLCPWHERVARCAQCPGASHGGTRIPKYEIIASHLRA